MPRLLRGHYHLLEEAAFHFYRSDHHVDGRDVAALALEFHEIHEAEAFHPLDLALAYLYFHCGAYLLVTELLPVHFYQVQIYQ